MKKPTLTKLKKMLAKSTGKAQKAVEEKKRIVYRYEIDSKEEAEIEKYVSRLKYVTPYMLTKKFEIKLSRSRLILRRLAAEGKLKLVEKNRELEIYVPIAA